MSWLNEMKQMSLEPDNKSSKGSEVNKLISKLEIWTKFMQSGKTQAIQDEIEKYIDANDDYFHIIFCSNNIFLCNQTQSRIKKTYGKERQKKQQKHFAQHLKALTYTSKDKINFVQLENKCRTHRAILCCTNKERLADMERLLTHSRIANTKTLSKVIVWIDEIHDRINATLPYLKKYAAVEKVKRIIGITATPEPLFQKLGTTKKITFKPMSACNDEEYYGFDDCKKKTIDYGTEQYKIPPRWKNTFKHEIEAALYIHTILTNKEIEYNEKDIFFIPGISKIKSHEAIKDVLVDHQFHVFMFNSKGRILYKCRPNERSTPISLNNDNLLIERTENFKCSIGKLLGNARDLYNLTGYPIAITGYLSLGQGNTLSDYDTNFYVTKCILPYHDLKASVFPIQVAGRCFGNLKQRKEFGFEGCQIIARSNFIQKLQNKIKYGACSQYALDSEKNSFSLQEYNEYLEIAKELDDNMPITMELTGPAFFEINEENFFQILSNKKNIQKYSGISTEKHFTLIEKYKVSEYVEIDDETDEKLIKQYFDDKSVKKLNKFMFIIDRRDCSTTIGEVTIRYATI